MSLTIPPLPSFRGWQSTLHALSPYELGYFVLPASSLPRCHTLGIDGLPYEIVHLLAALHGEWETLLVI